MALRARTLVSCVAARAVARTAAVPAVARRVCGSHARMTGASLRAMRAPQGAVWRTLATAAPDASVGGDADGEPVDYTALIPDNLHLHNPQDALPTSEPDYALDDVKTLPVLSFAAPGEVSGEVTLDNRVFGVEVRSDIVHRVVQWQLAKRRTKVYKTKNISETRGGGRKPWPQKNMGKARAGSIRASQWRGGNKPHGPKIRDWSQKLNKKIRRLGLRIALAAKYRERRVVVVDDVALESHKTGEFVSLLKAHGWDKARVLVVDDPEFDPTFLQASANVKRLLPLPVRGLNVFSILKMDLLVITPRALEGVYERLIDGYEGNYDLYELPGDAGVVEGGEASQAAQ